MPRPSLRSRSIRRVKVKTPGGLTKVHYRKKKPSKAVCRNCSKPLKGVPKERPYKMKTMPKSKKRPERPYGGNLCSVCTRRLLVEKSRSK